jgi:hypothetical protein
MIIHAKPIAYGLGERCYSDWHFRGGIGGVKNPKPEKPKEEEKEFFSEEEFKI